MFKKLNHPQGQVWFVGDIHGEWERFEALKKRVNFDEEVDIIVSVGDLCDRGPQSELCLDYLDKSWFHAVRGNHEDMIIKYFETDHQGYMAEVMLQNGAGWFIATPEDSQADYVWAFKALPLMIEIDMEGYTVGVVHADVSQTSWEGAKLTLANKEVQENLMWDRFRWGPLQNYSKEYIEGVDYLIVGHTPSKSVRQHGNVINIDTGSGKGGALTFFNIDKNQIESI